MPSIDSSKTSTINISVFYKILSNNIIKEKPTVELLQLLNEKENIYKYQYAFYADINELNSNIFIPVFHTMFLGCSNNNVIIGKQEDQWICELFPNNRYYMFENSQNNADLSSKNITIINSIKEIKPL